LQFILAESLLLSELNFNNNHPYFGILGYTVLLGFNSINGSKAIRIYLILYFVSVVGSIELFVSSMSKRVEHSLGNYVQVR
jgi:hypothetical protein